MCVLIAGQGYVLGVLWTDGPWLAREARSDGLAATQATASVFDFVASVVYVRNSCVVGILTSRVARIRGSRITTSLLMPL